MVDMPFEIFVTLVSITVVIPLLAYVFRTQFPPSVVLALGGAIWLLLFFSTDNIIMGYTNPLLTNSTTTNIVTGNTTYTYQQIYTPTTNINATSSGTVAYMTQSSGTSTVPLFAGSGNIVSAEHIADSSSTLINKPINQAVLSLKKTGAPTGNAQIGSFTDSNSNIVTLCSNLDVTTLTTSQADYTVNCPSVFFLSSSSTGENRFGIKYNAGDVSNSITMHVANSDVFDSTHSVRSAIGGGGWSDTTTSDLRMSLNYVTAPKYIRDSDARTYWINNIVQESPLCLQFDLGSTNIVNGFRLTSPDITKIPSAVKFYSSNDGSSYTFRQAINLNKVADRETYLTNDTFFVRYYQLCVDQYGTANNWQISELDFVYASSSNSNSSQQTENTYQNNGDPIPILFEMKSPTTGEPSFFSTMFIVSGLMFMMIGALVEVKGRNE